MRGGVSRGDSRGQLPDLDYPFRLPGLRVVSRREAGCSTHHCNTTDATDVYTSSCIYCLVLIVSVTFKCQQPVNTVHQVRLRHQASSNPPLLVLLKSYGLLAQNTVCLSTECDSLIWGEVGESVFLLPGHP